MTVLIGITQKPEETAKHFSEKYEEVQETTNIVGPFWSAKEASNWMEFIKARTDDYEHVLNPDPFSANKYWYGFTCECIEAKEISLHMPL